MGPDTGAAWARPARVGATVVRAGLPPMNSGVRDWGDWVVAVTDLGAGPVLVRAVVGLDRDRWLVPGTRLTLDVDPRPPGDLRAFRVDWWSVPPIRDRVAAGDPALADPRSARAFAARAASTAAPPVTAPEPSRGIYGHAPCSGPSLEVAAWTEACDRAIAGTAAPGPGGKIRAVVIPTAVRLVFSDLTHLSSGRPDPQADHHGLIHWHPKRGTEAVLSVNIAGRPPYAVFEQHFKAPKEKPATQAPWLYPWLPALVSPRDPRAVEILWDEVPPWQQVSPTLVPDPYEVGRPRA